MNVVLQRSMPREAGGVRVWASLCHAIHQVCDLRGDDAVNRAALLDECEQQPPEMQADLLAHFEDQARMYRAALNVPDPVSRYSTYSTSVSKGSKS